MSDIYDQHKAAFANVSAYVVVKDGELVARIAFKFPKDGAGRLFAYVHWLGQPMVRGFAAGGGYDKGSAACASAAAKMLSRADAGDSQSYAEFRCEMLKDNGATWNDRLRNVGFTVLSAV
jgi:hypothetical protein